MSNTWVQFSRLNEAVICVLFFVEMDGARHLNFFSDLSFSTVLADSRLENVIGRPVEVRVICGNQRYLFIGDSKGRVHLVGPDRLSNGGLGDSSQTISADNQDSNLGSGLNSNSNRVSQHLLCSIQLFGGRQCSILSLELLDVPNEIGPGYTTNLFALW